MGKQRPATMSEVAERAGVSKMTVSAVLAGGSRHVRVSEPTRRRVLETARQMGYRPNAVARSLRRQRTHILGLYCGFGYLNAATPFCGDVIGGLQAGCDAHGYDLLLHGIFAGRPVADIHAELTDGRIDGLVVLSPPDDPLLELLAPSHRPAVAMVDAVPALPSVVVDDPRGGELLVDYLVSRGHRRLLFGNVPRPLTSVIRRRAAVLAAAGVRGLEVSEHPAELNENAWEGVLHEWQLLPRDQRATAVVCWNDACAYELLEACHARSIRVPEDLAVTGFDGTCQPLHFQWRLTTVHAPWSAVAKTAVDLLVAQLNGTEVPPETVFPVQLIPGDSA
jgi:DNA-binding LacI/PurR family transcriptional regulator